MAEGINQPAVMPDLTAHPPVPSVAVQADDRENYRKAGEEYLEQKLRGTSARAAGSGTAPRNAARRRRDVEDPDLLVVGAVIEGSKLYLLTAAHVVCRAIGILCLKESMEHLATPALLVFVHQVAVAALLWALTLSETPAFHFSALQSLDMRGALPGAVLTALQMTLLFSSLSLGSVFAVAAFTTLAASTLHTVIPPLLYTQSLPRLSPRRQAALAGAALGAAYLLLSTWPGWGTPLLLALWSLAAAADAAWSAAITSRGGLPPALTPQLADAAAGARRSAPPLRAFLAHALPAAPVLVLALATHEGTELAQHDVSVPSLSVMVLSAACFAAAEASGLVVRPALPRLAAAALNGSFLVAVLLSFSSMYTEPVGVGTALALLGVAAGVTVSGAAAPEEAVNVL